MSAQTLKTTKKRYFFMDNLKATIIFMVVLYHVGWIYEGSGMLSSVWIVNDPSKNGLAGMMGLILDMFMMPTMFFISGFFTLMSLRKKSTGTFILGRIKRLLVPWLIACLVLIPLYKVFFLVSRGLPQEAPLSYFHFSGEILINQGWLWFLPVLFLFDMIFLLLSKLNPFVINIGIKKTVLGVFILGSAYSYLISVNGLYGWTKTALLDFQQERLLLYFLAFLLGALFFHQKVFESKPGKRLLYYITCGTIWLPMNVYVIFLLNMLFNPGQFIISGTVDRLLTWTAFNLSMLGMLYIMVCTFRYYIDRNGGFWKAISPYSYGVYIIHFIIMAIPAYLLLNVNLPSVVKYIAVTLITFTISNLCVYVYGALKDKSTSAVTKPITKTA